VGRAEGRGEAKAECMKQRQRVNGQRRGVSERAQAGRQSRLRPKTQAQERGTEVRTPVPPRMPHVARP